MFTLIKHQGGYHHDMHTIIDHILPKELCLELSDRVRKLIKENKVQLVSHSKQGTIDELDGGGDYLHHIFKGKDIREFFPELVGAYHSLVSLLSCVTCSETIISPYLDSDMNIKAYPKGGGTIGWHYDTNAITVLIYLTSNTEAPLKLKISRSHPSKKDSWTECEMVYASAGSMLLMKGREVWHISEPTDTEEKFVVVFNYYVEGDTWRPKKFDSMVYDGEKVNNNEGG